MDSRVDAGPVTKGGSHADSAPNPLRRLIRERVKEGFPGVLTRDRESLTGAILQYVRATNSSGDEVTVKIVVAVHDYAQKNRVDSAVALQQSIEWLRGETLRVRIEQQNNKS